MFKQESGSQEFSISYQSSIEKSSAFLKTGARITILSVLSREVKNQAALLRNKEHSKVVQEFLVPGNQDNSVKDQSMNSTSVHVRPAQTEGNPAEMVNEEDGDNEDYEGSIRIPNGPNNNNAENGKDRNSVKAKYGRGSKNSSVKTPFDYMKERKLSEPVMSPRKRSSVTVSKLSRCSSTVDLRDNEKPVLRELGGYKFFQKPSEASPKTPNRKANSYRSNENQTSEVADFENTISEQKKNIANREKHVLQLEKKICALETENSKFKKQVTSVREKLEDCSGTVDFLKREKEQLESDKDRLNYMLLTQEHEIKEIRAENVNLVTEYENAEQSRKIAVGHLQGIERASTSAFEESVESKKFIDQLSHLKECVHKLRVDRDALKEEHSRIGVFFEENIKILQDRVGEMDEKIDSERSVEMAVEVVISEGEHIFDEKTGDTGEEYELDEFRNRLKSNEKLIDQLADEIRELENKKKGLLENRFSMIQEFQAGRDVIDAEELDKDEECSEDSAKTFEASHGSRKQSNRVTRKIRKLERTLSMDHAVGKLDCIQKLCKKLEDCEQKMQELEMINSEMKAEHDDMEEEAKYLKYVLSYRGDVMKAQLEKEYENKVEAFKEEIRLANATSYATDTVSGQTFKELSERNRMLEEEVQRLDEQLKTLLQTLPALQGEDDQRRNSETVGNEEAGEAVRSLEEKVVHLTEEKRILLLSIQTLTGQRRSRDVPSTSTEIDTSMTQELLVLGKNLREIENENVELAETFERIREVLENDEDDVIDEHRDSSKISKLKGEIQKFSEKTKSSRRSNSLKDGSLGEVFASCARHEDRITELENEVNRLHRENKSLLSTIIRLQCDPNFTFSDDITDDDVSRSCLESPVKDMIQAMVATVDDEDGPRTPEAISHDSEDGPGGPKATPSHSEVGTSCSPRSYRDEEVQVNMNSQDLGGLLGYLERDLNRLRNALSQQCVVGCQLDSQNGENEHMSSADVEKMNMKLSELAKHANMLQEKLDESEAIRSDLHRAISIATDMASEERQRCMDLMQAKTALEKDLLKLAKENRDLRDGLDTLSRVRKRRLSRGNSLSRASPPSDRHEDDEYECYFPRPKSHNYSESELSDVDSPVPERMRSPTD